MPRHMHKLARALQHVVRVVPHTALLDAGAKFGGGQRAPAGWSHLPRNFAEAILLQAFRAQGESAATWCRMYLVCKCANVSMIPSILSCMLIADACSASACVHSALRHVDCGPVRTCREWAEFMKGLPANLVVERELHMRDHSNRWFHRTRVPLRRIDFSLCGGRDDHGPDMLLVDDYALRSSETTLTVRLQLQQSGLAQLARSRSPSNLDGAEQAISLTPWCCVAGGLGAQHDGHRAQAAALQRPHQRVPASAVPVVLVRRHDGEPARDAARADSRRLHAPQGTRSTCGAANA